MEGGREKEAYFELFKEIDFLFGALAGCMVVFGLFLSLTVSTGGRPCRWQPPAFLSMDPCT